MIIRDVRPDELDALSDLIMRSKAVWGYDAAFLEACRDELRLREEELDETELVVAEDIEQRVLGVAQIEVDGREAELLKLFIEPNALKSGVGKVLFDWSVERSRALGAARMVIEADPDAAAFYERMGAVEVGCVASGSVEGRTLPKLEYRIAKAF